MYCYFKQWCIVLIGFLVDVVGGLVVVQIVWIWIFQKIVFLDVFRENIPICFKKEGAATNFINGRSGAPFSNKYFTEVGIMYIAVLINMKRTFLRYAYKISLKKNEKKSENKMSGVDELY